jgi:TetR/AcrR family transcriptional regulator
MRPMPNAHTHRLPAADRQRQLLEAALNVFSRRGFKGATTKEIAAAAGVTEAIIFQHFPTKDALYSAVLELHLDIGEEQQWIAEINDCMERNDDEGLFRTFMHQILLSYRCDTALERVILFAALEGHEQGVARLQKQFAPIFERLLEYIAHRQRQGAFIKCDPHAILLGLGALAHQYGLLTRIFRAPIPDVPDERMSELFARILMHGVRENASPRLPKNKKQKSAGPSNRKAKK